MSKSGDSDNLYYDVTLRQGGAQRYFENDFLWPDGTEFKINLDIHDPGVQMKTI